MTYVAAAAAASLVTVIVLTAAPTVSIPLIASVNALVAAAGRAGTATENAVVDVAVGAAAVRGDAAVRRYLAPTTPVKRPRVSVTSAS